MVDHAAAADYRTLDLPPGATALEVERAHARLRALYAEGALGSYGLLDEGQRRRRLEEIEAAHGRIVAARRQLVTAVAETAADAGAATPADSPAAALRQARLQAGLSLKEVAAILKIGSAHLHNIEEERHELLPATVYLRGFLLAYAKTLQIPHPEELTSAYLARRPPAGQGSE